MAGLFDFKSAEDILQERRAATKANQQQLLNTIVAAAPKESRQASMLGAQLGMALGRALGGKSEKEQLTEFREMGGTIEEMQEKAGDNLQDPSYGANVLRQAQAEEQRRLGLLPQEMQEAIGEERRAEQLQQQFSSVDMSSPEALREGFKTAISTGNTQLANVYGTMYKQAVANRQAEQEVEKKRIFSDVQQQVASEFNATKDPVGFNQAMFDQLSANPLTAGLAQPYQDSLLKIGIDNMQRKADAANKPFTVPSSNVIKMVESGTVNDPSAEDLSDNDKRDYNIYISSRVTELIKDMPLDQAMATARQEAQAGVNKGKEGWFLDDPDTFKSPRNQGNGDWSIEVAK